MRHGLRPRRPQALRPRRLRRTPHPRRVLGLRFGGAAVEIRQDGGREKVGLKSYENSRQESVKKNVSEGDMKDSLFVVH